MSDDDSWSVEITRRRVLGGLLTVGAASSAAGSGTVALFSDTEASTGNTVQAGTLDLSVAGDPENAVLHVEDAVPDGSGTQSTTITNGGSLPGYLQFAITDFRSAENGVNDPESGDDEENDPQGPESGDDRSGELGEHLDLRMKLVVDDEDHWLVDDATIDVDGAFTTASRVRLGERDLGALELTSGDTVELVAEYELQNVGNEIQSDSFEIDAVFGLAQKSSQSVVPEPAEVDATAVSPDDETPDAGVRFDFTNEFGQSATITDVHVQPEDTTLALLSDERGGNDYESFDFESDVHVATPEGDQNGWVDGGSGEFAVPGWINLGNDGWNSGAQQEATLSAGNTATVNLYAFRSEGEEREDMAGKPLRVTFDVTLDDDSTETVAFAMTPE